MGLSVLKFGGTSVGTPERIRTVAARIAEKYRSGEKLVVVVSAMGRSTDDLIGLAHQVSAHPPHREMDMLLTAGERISMALLSMALSDLEVGAVSLTGSQSGILTDGAHRRARIRRILGDRVRAAIDSGKVAIVAGFQGMSEGTKEITTLGRGGSDTTAVALAASLGATSCDIYTDVEGVYSADPRIVPAARHWPRLPHDLMVELATRGAGVLHPRSVELARQFGVRLRVLNSMKAPEASSGSGTEIVARSVFTEAEMEEFRVTGISADLDRVRVSVELMRPTVLSALCDRAAEGHLSLGTPFFREGRVEFYVEDEAISDWKRILQALGSDGFVKDWRIDESWVPLSVVGDRFTQDGAAIGAVLETLAQSGTSVTMGSASALGLTVSVPRTHATDCVRALHDRFFPGSATQGTP
jgi:aspartate kinase